MWGKRVAGWLAITCWNLKPMVKVQLLAEAECTKFHFLRVGSGQFQMVSMRSEKPICAPALFRVNALCTDSPVPVLPLSAQHALKNEHANFSPFLICFKVRTFVCRYDYIIVLPFATRFVSVAVSRGVHERRRRRRRSNRPLPHRRQPLLWSAVHARWIRCTAVRRRRHRLHGGSIQRQRNLPQNHRRQ